jgi:hypothetical protein
MPVICTLRVPGVTPELYDEVRTHLAWEANPPEGGMAHFISFTDDEAIEVDIWETKEGFENFFRNHLVPACSLFGFKPPNPVIRDIYLMALAPVEERHMVPRAITREKVSA